MKFNTHKKLVLSVTIKIDTSQVVQHVRGLRDHCTSTILKGVESWNKNNKVSIHFSENGTVQIIEKAYLLSTIGRTSYLNMLDLNNIDARFEDLKNPHRPIHKTISGISNFYY